MFSYFFKTSWSTINREKYTPDPVQNLSIIEGNARLLSNMFDMIHNLLAWGAPMCVKNGWYGQFLP